MKFLGLLFAIVSLQMTAQADQCQWNSRTDANSAVKLIKNNDIIFWCQNCGDKKPSRIFRVTDVQVRKEQMQGFPPGRIVNVEAEYLAQKGGTDLDLAYVYVRTASDIFTNIAQLVGCPSSGATTFIQTGPGVRKVAHFYDKNGERVDVTASEQEIAQSDFMKPANRIPASTK